VYHLQLTFILSTVLAMSYYAMWTGLGVTFKTTDTTPRVIFWGRYVGHLIAAPVKHLHTPIRRSFK